MPQIQLIYVSSAQQELTEEALDSILEASIRRNAQQGITGMLLYSKGSFMQVIEGDEAAIDETYGRICQDPRHRNIYLLAREPIEQREFPLWSMGFRRFSSADTQHHPAYTPFCNDGFNADLMGATPGVATEILKTFSRQ